MELERRKHCFYIFGENDELEMEGGEIYAAYTMEEAKVMYEKQFPGFDAHWGQDDGPIERIKNKNRK